MRNLWFKHLVRLNLPVYQYESDKMKIIYAGYSSIKRNYFVRMLLDRNSPHTFLGRRWFWKIPDLIKSYNIDMVISEISQIALNSTRKWNGYILPVWAEMIINIDQPISEISKRGVTDFSNVTRRIRKYNLTCEILTDKESLNYFNEKIYLPYITNRHGDEALIDDLNKMWESSPSSSVMAVRENGIIVGGALIKKSGDSLELVRVGLLDGNEEYRRHGVIGALYYFGILEGQKAGCKHFSVGGTRPFLTDGLTKYKMGLGAEFVEDIVPGSECVWLGFNDNSNCAKEYMHNNPFMYINEDYKLLKYRI
jgi:hypothetical protein